ncbi:MAG TPA: hypothetical protein VNB22_03355 [Pyrinomonadaceae bacterium]|jgi:hypothetical protein|nr:hypothetical protein [Pyrinomonadaceae bacterium]
MKLSLLVILLAAFSNGCGSFSTEAQIKLSTNGRIGNNNTNQANSKIKPKTVDISKVDFNNFTYPDFSGGKVDKNFTLKKGKSEKKAGEPNYYVRKTYYFDLTGDEKDEAITHIMAEGCQVSCDPRSLFYVHTMENDQPKLIWKVATGVDELGGLKSVHFKVNEIVLESFGECSLENWWTKPNIDVKNNPKLKAANYTRFVFSRGSDGFTQTSRDLLPLGYTNFLEYRPQINFGKN